MTTLHGRIEEGVLANLLQYLSLSQASGCLLLRHPQSRQGYVYFEHGRIVFVEAKPSYDLAALAALLRWRDGQFSFRPGVRSPRITLERSTEMLLLEAAHLVDEDHVRTEAGPVLDADTVLSAVADRPATRAVLGQSAERHGLPPDGQEGEARDATATSASPQPEPDGDSHGVRDERAWSTAAGQRDKSGRSGRAGRSSRSNVRARAYAVMLPDVRPSPADDSGAEAGEADLVTDTAAEADRAEQVRVVEEYDGATLVALSLSALLLYRRLDGHKSLREHAADLDRKPTEMVRAGRELLDARLAEYVTLIVADPRFAVELAREAVDLLGPVGEIVVEDALYDLGLSADTLPVSSVDELVQELSGAFKNAFTRADFLRRVTELRRLFALDPTVPGRTR